MVVESWSGMQKKDEHFKTLYLKSLKINGYVPTQLRELIHIEMKQFAP